MLLQPPLGLVKRLWTSSGVAKNLHWVKSDLFWASKSMIQRPNVLILHWNWSTGGAFLTYINKKDVWVHPKTSSTFFNSINSTISDGWRYSKIHKQLRSWVVDLLWLPPFSKLMMLLKWQCSAFLKTVSSKWVCKIIKHHINYLTLNSRVSNTHTASFKTRKTWFHMACKEEQFDVVDQFKTLSINLNAPHVNGITHFYWVF